MKKAIACFFGVRALALFSRGEKGRIGGERGRGEGKGRIGGERGEELLLAAGEYSFCSAAESRGRGKLINNNNMDKDREKLD